MARPLNVAILGAGIGRAHLAAYLALPERFRVRYLCDRDIPRATGALLETGADPALTGLSANANEVFADPAVDIIDICLPPHLHVPMTSAALKAGKHVICEKPLASALSDVDRLAALSQETGRTVFPVFQYRYGPGLARLQALIAAGLAGKPLIASLRTHWNRDAAYYDNPWRGTWAGEQGGAILGHAIHNHDILTTIFGPVRQLHAFAATRVNPIETEDCATLSLVMQSGALATSSVTLGHHDDSTDFTFCFEFLTAQSGLNPYAPADGAWTFSARGAAVNQAAIDACISALPPCPSGFAGFFTAVADHLQSLPGGAPAVTLADGRRSIELVTAIYASARSGQPVSLPLDTDHPLYDGWLPTDAKDDT